MTLTRVSPTELNAGESSSSSRLWLFAPKGLRRLSERLRDNESRWIPACTGMTGMAAVANLAMPGSNPFWLCLLQPRGNESLWIQACAGSLVALVTRKPNSSVCSREDLDQPQKLTTNLSRALCERLRHDWRHPTCPSPRRDSFGPCREKERAWRRCPRCSSHHPPKVRSGVLAR